MIVQFASFLLLSKADYSGLIHISQNYDKNVVENYLQYTKNITVDKLLTYFVIGQIVGVVQYLLVQAFLGLCRLQRLFGKLF